MTFKFYLSNDLFLNQALKVDSVFEHWPSAIHNQAKYAKYAK